MKRFAWLLLLFPLLYCQTPAQTNVRGWYADGQVWILWNLDNNPPETYAIYSSPTPFTTTSQAQLVGRLYEEEWLPFALRTQLSPTLSYVIPDGQGGRLTLSANTGLFVQTVLQTGASYYAIVKWGQTAVTSNNLTSTAINYQFSLNQPTQCQPQVTTTLPSGHKATAYYLWVDGRDDENGGRADFPVMANWHKNGMPNFFIVSEAKNLPAGKVSAIHWLHGGAGTANQSLPTDRASINIEPQDGLLVAHNDDLISRVLVNGVAQKVIEESNTWWFGWPRGFDPFDNPREQPVDNDTIINYTQRRILWINDWLIRNRNVEATRVVIQGHSMGSAGTTALAKAFPGAFATATILSNGFAGPHPSDGFGIKAIGTQTQNLPTNLRNRQNEVVRAYDVFNLATPISSERDMTLMRSWHGKLDNNTAMHWSPFVVEEYKRADANAWGMQLYWDERTHELGNLQVHWSNGAGNNQTERDDAAYQARYRTSQSFPAFFNHQKYPGANKNPGDGTIGIGVNGSGDDWGTYGGYHDWETDTLTDTASKWEVIAFLIGQSSHTVDDFPGPGTSLTADLAIRRPQQFKPVKGIRLNWRVTRVSGNTLLQSGQVIVGDDDLVTIPGVIVYKAPDRVRITATPMAPAVTASAASYNAAAISEKAIVAAFGVSLATSTQTAAAIPLPTTLAGTTVRVRDSAGIERLAPLFFVSSGQVNYQIPAGTATGTATVIITNGEGLGSIGTMEVRTAAPSFFTTDQSGTGAAAALDAFSFTSAPFNARQPNGQPNILAVFGTGLGGDATDVDGDVNASVTARLDNNPVTVLYAGRAPGFTGLNQFNLLLPAGLTSGTHTLTLSRSGVTSNTVTIAIR
jgi:uncharacterized protein (TIGR03437 family)